MNHERIRNSIWWGPPKKFSTKFEERKISWLELFYDLVYAIVISRTTHLLAINPNALGILDYSYLFAIIFWGWVNGSLYHDLHGSQGIRTRLMTLWQMMAVAALAVTLSSPPGVLIFRATIAFIFLQIYITYLWWSVGIYDKNHRILNRPYTYCYLAALTLIIITLFVPQPYKRILFWLVVVLNYLPRFIAMRSFKKRNLDFPLSSSMVERLGLFTIIIFGEAILGVINGTGTVENINASVWVCFGLGILIVFALWWVFFSLIADRQIQSGLLKGLIVPILYIPTLASLGMVSASFPGLIDMINHQHAGMHSFFIKAIFGLSLSIFLISILTISRYLQYPKEYEPSRKIFRPVIFLAAGFISFITLLFENRWLAFSVSALMFYLILIFSALLIIIILLTRVWFKIESKRLNSEQEKPD